VEQLLVVVGTLLSGNPIPVSSTTQAGVRPLVIIL